MSPEASSGPSRRYVLVSPCRDEADFMRRTLDSVLNQSEPPALWVIVDDGSTDESPEILADYARRSGIISIVRRPDRGRRNVGPGVIEAFYAGLETVDLGRFDYLCKLDLDLDLPRDYFAILMDRMEANPRLGSCSGKPWFTWNGRHLPERCGDEMSVGMTKFYRTACFQDIGGFVREVMWDAIDCHKSRQLGWQACAFNDPELGFEHLRPMGSSQKNIFVGRMRHGYGQYFMGSDFFFFTASCLSRIIEPPYLVGAVATWIGYVRAALQGKPRLADPALVAFVRRYQRRALRVGKRQAVREIDARPHPRGAGRSGEVRA